jgi:DeoR family fructose operon transcriptional repressor
MLISERHQKILSILQTEKTISIQKLVKVLYVSEATLRRDLTKMEQQGLLQRTYGGATIIESSSKESSILIREQTQIKEKRKIAIKCLDILKDNYSYFIDSSSTVGHLLYHLNNFKDLTVITNGLNNAIILTQTTKANVFLTSGMVYTKTNSILGIDTIEYIRKFNCNSFLFSCSGISPEGITEANFEQSLVKKEMLKHSKEHILLVDHTKFNKIFLCRNCGFEDIDYIITDEVPEQEYIDLFNQNNVKLIIA